MCLNGPIKELPATIEFGWKVLIYEYGEYLTPWNKMVIRNGETYRALSSAHRAIYIFLRKDYAKQYAKAFHKKYSSRKFEMRLARVRLGDRLWMGRKDTSISDTPEKYHFTTSDIEILSIEELYSDNSNLRGGNHG